MPYFLHQPEEPIAETWEWMTDVIEADSGVEQRIELRPYPKRKFEELFVFDGQGVIRSAWNSIRNFGSPFERPLYQYATRLTAPSPIADTTIAIVSRKSDLREGQKAYIFDRTGGEVVTIDSITSSVVTITAGLSRAYGMRAQICPIVDVYSVSSDGVAYSNSIEVARSKLASRETGFHIPFVHDFNTFVLPEFDSLPVVNKRPKGTDFPNGFVFGNDVVDFGSTIELRDTWRSSRITITRSYLCHRHWDQDDWDFWRQFADYAKGSCNPFLIPSFAADLEYVSGAGTAITVRGTEYATELFPQDEFRRLVFITDEGETYSKVTNAVVAAGNTNLTLSVAMPADAIIALLLKVRIADDRVVCYHYGLHSEITLVMRTVPDLVVA